MGARLFNSSPTQSISAKNFTHFLRSIIIFSVFFFEKSRYYLSSKTMSKSESFASPAVLIEPDHDEERSAKRRKLCEAPITVVSALLALARPASTQKAATSSRAFPISVRINGQEPRQVKAETVDSNHVSDDEDELVRRPLSKPCLPHGVLAMPSRCLSSTTGTNSELSCVSYDKSPKLQPATSILPIVLPIGRPLSAAPCLPSVAPGEIVGLSNMPCV